MADKAQSHRLRALGYVIRGNCGYCVYGNYTAPTALDGWGNCDKHISKNHPSGLVIHVTGSCPQFLVNPARVALTKLGAHEEFFNGGRREANGS
jgi:hypothetical protein